MGLTFSFRLWPEKICFCSEAGCQCLLSFRCEAFMHSCIMELITFFSHKINITVALIMILWALIPCGGILFVSPKWMKHVNKVVKCGGRGPRCSILRLPHQALILPDLSHNTDLFLFFLIGLKPVVVTRCLSSLYSVCSYKRCPKG